MRNKLKKIFFLALVAIMVYGCSGGVSLTGYWAMAQTASTGTTASNMILQLQQAGQSITGISLENNQQNGMISMGIISGSTVTLTINFTIATAGTGYRTGPVTYNGMIYPDGNTMILTPNVSSTGLTPTPITFIRRG